MTDKVIEWTIPMRERFRKAHAEATAVSSAQFVFEENTFDTRYAGYLLEYLDMKMEKPNG